MTSLLIATCLLGGQVSTQAKRDPVIQNEAGFIRATFFAPKGIITVILPDDITPGDNISGTVFTDNKEISLPQINIILGDKIGVTTDPDGPRRSWKIPQTTEPRISLTVWTQEGTVAGTTYVPVSPAKSKPTAFVIPTFARIGSPLAVKGLFDGETTNTVVKMGDQVLPVVAESPRETVVLIPSVSLPGQNSMEILEKGQQAKAPCRLLKVALTTPKTTLQKGEHAELSVSVEGISDLGDAKAPMIIVENLTPKAIDLDGKVKHFLFAKPSKDGDYVYRFLITSLMAGSFSVSANVDPGSGTKVETTKSSG